mmetsp:Transcript_20413/g.81634  ORF Transcript_20413/g.81634 Transcript_20413/m.81634 type:complete len:418 (-) Transcript_20413:310-1563(-)
MSMRMLLPHRAAGGVDEGGARAQRRRVEDDGVGVVGRVTVTVSRRRRVDREAHAAALREGDDAQRHGAPVGTRVDGGPQEREEQLPHAARVAQNPERAARVREARVDTAARALLLLFVPWRLVWWRAVVGVRRRRRRRIGGRRGVAARTRRRRSAGVEDDEDVGVAAVDRDPRRARRRPRDRQSALDDGVEVKVDRGRLGAPPEPVRRAARRFFDGPRLDKAAALPAAERRGDVEQVAHDGAQQQRRAAHRVEVRALRLVERRLGEQLREPEHGVQRRAQLVRHHRVELLHRARHAPPALGVDRRRAAAFRIWEWCTAPRRCRGCHRRPRLGRLLVNVVVASRFSSTVVVVVVVVLGVVAGTLTNSCPGAPRLIVISIRSDDDGVAVVVRFTTSCGRRVDEHDCASIIAPRGCCGCH